MHTRTTINTDCKYYDGAMLTKDAISTCLHNGLIKISDFDSKRLNPNSYNIKIANMCRTYCPNPEYDAPYIDLKDPNTFDTNAQEIPESGLILYPNQLYLIPTLDYLETDFFIPMITGRSSMGRVGIQVHNEAGFGDVGFKGNWTLQVSVKFPTKIYPYIQMAQLYFLTPKGRILDLYNGSYQNSNGAVGSKFIMS